MPQVVGATGALRLVFCLTESREQQSGKILFKNDEYIFREQYIINVDVKNFFSELNPALGRIADDFAASVVTTVLEGF